MAIMRTCPQCGQSQEVAADLLGNDFHCLACLSGPAQLAQQGSVARRFLNVLLLAAIGDQGHRLNLSRFRERDEGFLISYSGDQGDRLQACQLGEWSKLCGELMDQVVELIPPPTDLVDALADELGSLGLGEWQKGKVPALQHGVLEVALGKESLPVRYDVGWLANGVFIYLKFTTTPVQAQCAKAIREEIDFSELNRLIRNLESFEDGPIASQYEFEALDMNAEEIRGTLEAFSEDEACERIRQMGYFGTRLVWRSRSPSSSSVAVADRPLILCWSPDRETGPRAPESGGEG